MEKRILALGEKEIPYLLSHRNRRYGIGLSIRAGEDLRVSASDRMSDAAIERELLRHRAWILRAVEKFSKMPKPLLERPSRKDYKKYKEAARELARARLEHFNQFYNFSYKSITIRMQKTRWGSCSRRGTLSFNYQIALLPPELSDYIVVHELCHIGQFDHSKKFWELVAKTIPDWKTLRKKLKGTVG